MKLAIIESPWMKDLGYRLDTKPYVGGALQTKVMLDQLPLRKDKLGSVCKAILNIGRIKRDWVSDSEYGVPFLSGTDIQKADFSNLSLISKRAVKANPNLILDEGMTLITRSGSIGKMAYCRSEMSGKACTEDVLRVVPDPSKILPGYLYAFLSSKFGVPLMTSGTYGAIIQHLEPEHIENIGVPRLPPAQEKEIHELVEEAGRNLTSYSSNLHSATEKLLSWFGLEEIPPFGWRMNEARTGWIQRNISPLSLRALNYDVRIAPFFDYIRQHKHSKLGDLCDQNAFSGWITFKRVDSALEHGVMLISQKQAFHFRPEGRIVSKKSIEGLGLQVPAGTTVIPSHGTLGENELYCRAVYVTEGKSKYAYSGDFFRCIPIDPNISPGYIFAFLRSNIAFRMLRSMSTGGKQQTQPPHAMYDMPIPRLEPSKEKVISDLVDGAANSYDQAFDCENRARELLEEIVESY